MTTNLTTELRPGSRITKGSARIRLRGELDNLHAEWALIEFKYKVHPIMRNMIKNAVINDCLQESSVWYPESLDTIHKESRSFPVDFSLSFLDSIKKHEINIFRTKIRVVETTCIEVLDSLENPEERAIYESIALLLNRMSSFAYTLTRRSE